MTFIEYEKYYIANLHHEMVVKDAQRTLLSTIMNFGGMGLEKSISASEVIPLPLIDVDETKLPITTHKRALEVFRYILED